MSEDKVSFLYKAATAISDVNNQSLLLLQSYYLMRCNGVTKTLPPKHFSHNLRCSHCYNQWRQGVYENKIIPVKLSKKQRRRIRTRKESMRNKDEVKKRKDLLHSNQIERTCPLCKHKTVITARKPLKATINKSTQKIVSSMKNLVSSKEPSKNQTKTSKLSKNENKQEINVYCDSKDIFSLYNKNNIISGSVKEKPKVIKNNKKKKDKFAGLCKEAVIASAKLKNVENKSKLNLFLKPSL